MITICCAWLPHFALRVLAHQRVDLSRPVAISSSGDVYPVVIDCSDAARADGVVPGMLVSRALGCSNGLEVLDNDAERVALAAERFLMRLEQLGAAVHPIEPGRAMFEVEPLLLMHGGLSSLLTCVRKMYSAPDLRLGLGPNPFVAWVAAQHAHAGGHVAIVAAEAPRVLADMPLDLVPADDRTLRLLHALGLKTLGEFASIDRAHITDRLGAEGALLHALARGDDDTVLAPRIPVDPIEEYLNFPEPLAASDVLGRALNMLLERALSHPRCVQYAPRAIVVVATLVPPSPGMPAPTHRVRRVLRVPTVDLVRVHTACLPALAEIPAPVDRLTVRLEEFEPRTATQQSLLGRNTSITGGDSVEAAESMADGRVQASLRQVQAAAGDDALLQVLELNADSRMPERHAVLVPRHVTDAEAWEDRK
ncbi:MAG: hypothetical protein H7123_09010 [Thermoleophilia bacterium]|nr:hypothetical protein [Thermoleophilia bacterium]